VKQESALVTAIEIRGKMHTLELSFLTPLPAKYHLLIPENQPNIREIIVSENKLSVLSVEKVTRVNDSA
jgi:hypothetical protein